MKSNLLDRAKLLFRKDKELCLSLREILGFYPHDTELYRIALAHKSSEYRNRTGRPLNNERLEFLGDAILEAVVSDIVFHRYDRRREGFLTNTRSKIVQRETLNRLAKELGLERLIQSNSHSNNHNSYLGGNAFEALFGAVYLDRGYRVCKWFFENRILGRFIDLDGVAHKEVNFKSKLLEWSQKNRIRLEFALESKQGDSDSSPEFHSLVRIEGLLAGKGSGYSKKESQQNAAKEALTKLRREPQFIEKIFGTKESRTAMEAEEVAALPKIDEIENAILQEEKDQAAQGENAAGESAKRPSRRRRRAAQPKAAPTAKAAPAQPEQPAAAQQKGSQPAKKSSDIAQESSEAPQEASAEAQGPAAEPQEKSPSRRRRRRRASRAAVPPADDEEAAAAKEREALICAAEEEAFRTQ